MERPRPPRTHRPEGDRKKVIVVSSEPGPNYDLLCEKLNKYTFLLDDPIILVRGPAGANRLITKWAEWKWLLYQVWHADEYLTPAMRNTAMIEAADFLVAFDDGDCKSTARMVTLAQRANLLTKVVKL